MGTNYLWHKGKLRIYQIVNYETFQEREGLTQTPTHLLDTHSTILSAYLISTHTNTYTRCAHTYMFTQRGMGQGAY